jgi:hypothetical protein
MSVGLQPLDRLNSEEADGPMRAAVDRLVGVRVAV